MQHEPEKNDSGLEQPPPLEPTIHRPGSHQLPRLQGYGIEASHVQWVIKESGYVSLCWGAPICPWCYGVMIPECPTPWEKQRCEWCRKVSTVLVALPVDPWDYIVVIDDELTEGSQWLIGGLV